MSSRDEYMPGPAAGAEVRKDWEKWTLILVRELRHPPEKVWVALTEPASLREWAMKFGWPRLNAEYAQQFGI